MWYAKELSGRRLRRREVPNISLERVLKAAGLIEQMKSGLLKPQKEKEK